MEPSKLNLKCAETILSRYRISNPKVARDIALTIDQAEEAAASNLKNALVDRVRETADYFKHCKGFNDGERALLTATCANLATQLEKIDLVK